MAYELLIIVYEVLENVFLAFVIFDFWSISIHLDFISMEKIRILP